MKDLEKQQTAMSQSSNLHSSRDGYVDFFKGLLILWVIHIHTVFWSGREYLSENIRQASLLADVTTFFFISGYLTKPTSFTDACKRAFKQFKNLYLNYLALSLLLLGPLSVAYFLRKGLVPNFQQDILFMLSVLKLEAPGDVWGVIPVYRGSFWYLWVYFSLLLVTPFLIACFKTRKSRIVVLTTLLLLLYIFNSLGWNFVFFLTEATYIYFYAFIYLLGMAYRIDGSSIQTRLVKLSFLINIAISLTIFFGLDGQVLNLHTEKFPPSFKYLAYSLLLIHIFVLLQRAWNYPNSENRKRVFLFLEWCGKNSYFIYLLQGVICSIPFYFLGLLLNRFSIAVTYLIILVFNVFFTLLSTLLYLKAKSKFMSFLDSFREKKRLQTK